jgi:hypothetical protein
MTFAEKAQKMTAGNAKRFVVSKVQKAIKSDNEDYIKDVAALMFEYDSDSLISQPSSCDKCPAEDFGYCGLRHFDIDPIKMFKEYCAVAFLKSNL